MGERPGITGKEQDGIALVLVLWVLALLTVIAMGMTTVTRTEMSLSGNRVNEARLRALSDAAISMVVLRLGSQEEADHWLPDGSVHAWRFADRDLQIRLYNESSRVDLNKTTEDTLVRLLVEKGVASADAEHAVSILRDWQDRDDSVRPQGAEDSAYKAQGMAYGSKDLMFHDVGELSLLLPPFNQLIPLLSQHTTVHSNSTRVVAEYADATVLAALGDTQQERDRPRRSDGDEEDGGPRARRINLGGPVYRLQVNVAGDAAVVETVFRVAGLRNGVSILSRRYEWRGVFAVQDASETAALEETAN